MSALLASVIDWTALGRAAAAAVAGALVVVVSFSAVVVAGARVEEAGRRRPADIALIAAGLLVCALAIGLGLWAMLQKG